MIKPIGNRIIVKQIKASTKSGIILSNGVETNGNTWGEVIALPEVSDNIWIKHIKVGDKVLYKKFQADKALSLSLDEDLEVVDIEPNEGTRPGQVLAWEKNG